MNDVIRMSDPAGMVVAMGELTDLEEQILVFEHQWWKYAGAKEQAVRDRFNMSATRYYQMLNALIDRPEAMAYDAPVVRRLLRLRAARAWQRNPGRLIGGV